MCGYLHELLSPFFSACVCVCLCTQEPTPLQFVYVSIKRSKGEKIEKGKRNRQELNCLFSDGGIQQPSCVGDMNGQVHAGKLYRHLKQSTLLALSPNRHSHCLPFIFMDDFDSPAMITGSRKKKKKRQ